MSNCSALAPAVKAAAQITPKKAAALYVYNFIFPPSNLLWHTSRRGKRQVVTFLSARYHDHAALMTGAHAENVLRHAHKPIDTVNRKRGIDLQSPHRRIDDSQLLPVVAIELLNCLGERRVFEDKHATSPTQRVRQLLVRVFL